MDTQQQPWQDALEKLRTLNADQAAMCAAHGDPETICAVWFDTLTYLGRDGDVIFLFARDEFHGSWVLRNYSRAIFDAFGGGVGEINVTWPNCEKCPPQPPKPRNGQNHGGKEENAVAKPTQTILDGFEGSYGSENGMYDD